MNHNYDPIKSVHIKNFGNLKYFRCDSFSNINLIIGKNGTGKTFLLKSLYVAIRSAEEYMRGDDNRTINEILAEKLRWTYQMQNLGDLVTKSASERLKFSIFCGKSCLQYHFSKDATKQIISTYIDEAFSRNNNASNSIFIPAKEVLSIDNIILTSRERDHAFGFDDTYYDLVKVLRIAPTRGKNYSSFAYARKELKELVNGKVDFDESTGKWFYKIGNQKFAIGVTAEGIKKIAILDRLLANGYIGKSSIIFIDELENALHPTAISNFIDILYNISKEMNIQLFLSSHSYFVIKKLCLLAQAKKEPITCISFDEIGGNYRIEDLSQGMPNNAIIDESIRLYEEEIDQVL